MISKVNETFNLGLEAEDVLVETFFSHNSADIDEWLAGKCANNSHVLFFYDSRPTDEKDEAPPGPPELCLCTVPDVTKRGKACFFLRQSDKPINLKFAQDTTLNFGELAPGPLNLFKSLIEKAWTPLLREADDWGKVKDGKERADFLEQTDDYIAALEKQV
jgi:hypothetical protein